MFLMTSATAVGLEPYECLPTPTSLFVVPDYLLQMF